jgi:hypothetical protein
MQSGKTAAGCYRKEDAMPTFEELWLKSPDLLGMNAEQIAKARKLAKFIYNQVVRHANKQKAAKKI